MDKSTAWFLLVLGVVLFVIDLSTYNFNFSYSNITTLGWVIYGAATILIILGAGKLLTGG